eukprot:jgi/Mesvir1/6563/Mv16821-RA.1
MPAPRGKLGVLCPLKKDSDYDRAFHYFTTEQFQSCKSVFGLDDDDDRGRHALGLRNASVVFQRPSEAFELCKLWARMALKAFEDPDVAAVVLLGEDITVEDLFVETAISLIERYTCVVMREASHPGWPSFPVMARSIRPAYQSPLTERLLFMYVIITISNQWNMALLGNLQDNHHNNLHVLLSSNKILSSCFGRHASVQNLRHLARIPEFLPAIFVNQDADPFLFGLYRRLGQAYITPTVQVSNRRGGVAGGLNPVTEPHYRRVSVEWRTDILQSSLIAGGQELPPTVVTVDVCVPMSRPRADFVRELLLLSVPRGMDVRIIVCLDVDRPLRDDEHGSFRDLERSAVEGGRCLRVRINRPGRRGASATRQRMLDECHSEWVLFLDDDVFPHRNLLSAYYEQIQASGHEADGFVGLTRLPRDGRVWTEALHATTTFFWRIAEYAEANQTRAPWGVTANLMLRWSPALRFDERFPKSGGGEDIDICIQAGNLLPAASAVVDHPWRPSMASMLKRLFEWALGDGLLNTKYSEFVFWTFPAAPEWALLCPFLLSLGLVMRSYALFLTGALWVPFTVLCDMGSMPLCFLVVLPLLSPEGIPQEFHGPITLWKLGVAMASGITHNASEFGHLCGHLRRGHLSNLCHRFDFFLGQLSSSSRSCNRFDNSSATRRQYELVCWMPDSHSCSGCSCTPKGVFVANGRFRSDALSGVSLQLRKPKIFQRARFSTSASQQGSGTGYQEPPDAIRSIVDAPPSPSITISPNRDLLLYMQRRPLIGVEELATPDTRLAGLRIDTLMNTRSRMSFYMGMTIATLGDEGMPGPEMPFKGIPAGAKLNFMSWSRDGKRIAFTIRHDPVEVEEGPGGKEVVEGADSGKLGLALWVADAYTREAKELFAPPKMALNTIFEDYHWVDDRTIVATVVPPQRGRPPKRPLRPYGPKIENNAKGNVSQARTYPDLLKNAHDEDVFEFYSTSQLVSIDVIDGTVTDIGRPQMYTHVSPSPDGKFLLVSTMHRPFSYNVPCGRFPKRVELWRRDGSFVAEMCDLPLAETIPITFNSVRKGKRSIAWRPDKECCIYWVETQDGGDAKVEVSPRDIVYMVDANEVAAGAAEGQAMQPQVIATTNLRYGGISWCDENLALIYESWYKTRTSRTWMVNPSDFSKPPELLWDRMYEDVYTDPGNPMTRRNSLGRYVLATVDPPEGDPALTGGRWRGRKLLLEGDGATPQGDKPFLDTINLDTKETKRIWSSPGPDGTYLDGIVSLMCGSHERLQEDNLSLMVVRQSPREPPQVYIRNLPGEAMRQITQVPHPYPQLKDLQKEIIRYKREDGVNLMGTLYLPPGYKVGVDKPLPTLLWAYPREFKDKDAAGQVRGSPNEFAGIGASSPLLFLAMGYAILDGPTMPIIGEKDEEANDRYVEQLVMSAKAAVEEVVRRGVADPKKICVGGHSYGAFMTANLLAHAPDLFACGIAKSGAYNRTLTPFGFQAEERTLWQAPDVYMKMSPFMEAHRISKPLLLVHGEDDDNAGTYPMQSERFYAALRGHGAQCRLVILPHESHGYRARESLLHVLWEMWTWMEQHTADHN